MGGFCTYRKIAGKKSRTLQSAAAALSFSVIASTLSACQAPATLASSRAAKPAAQQPAASPAVPVTAAAFLKKSDGEMIGLGDHDLTAALGQPSHIRHDDPATVWQYSANDCVIDFYLYQANTGMQVAYVEARDHKAKAEGTQACVHSLLQPNEALVQKTADNTAN